MAYKVIVKKRFLNKLEKTLTFLEQEWGKKAAQDFIQKVDTRINSLKHHPHIGAPSHKINNVRGIHITKHNRLFYKIEENTIIILNMYDTRKKTYR